MPRQLPLQQAAPAHMSRVLSPQLGVIAHMPRLRHTAYSDFGGRVSAELNATYADLVDKLPGGVLRAAYGMIQAHVCQCQEYVESWIRYQALWDLEPAAVVARLGSDLADWLAVVTDLRSSSAPLCMLTCLATRRVVLLLLTADLTCAASLASALLPSSHHCVCV